jgi:hypothetical protein
LIGKEIRIIYTKKTLNYLYFNDKNQREVFYTFYQDIANKKEIWMTQEWRFEEILK